MQNPSSALMIAKPKREKGLRAERDKDDTRAETAGHSSLRRSLRKNTFRWNSLHTFFEKETNENNTKSQSSNVESCRKQRKEVEEASKSEVGRKSKVKSSRKSSSEFKLPDSAKNLGGLSLTFTHTHSRTHSTQSLTHLIIAKQARSATPALSPLRS